MNFLAIFQRIRQWFTDIWQRADKQNRNRFFVIAGVMLALIIVAVTLLNRVVYVTLIDNLNTDASSKVTTALTAQGYKYTTENGGTRIMVPEKDQVAAAAYIATSGVLNDDPSYDLFMRGSGLTTSQFEKEQWRQYQTEEKIRTVIKAMDNVSSAAVSLAIPEKKLSIYSRDNDPVTASVHIRTADGAPPSKELTEGIKVSTAAAVSGLIPDNVTVTSQHGLVVADPTEEYIRLYEDHYAFKQKVRSNLESSLLRVFTDIAGEGHVNVGVFVEVDFDKESSQSITYYPVVDDEGIVESMQTVSETARNYGIAVGEPGMDENGGGDDYDEIEQNNEVYYENLSTTTNYKISEIRSQIEKAEGTLTELTATVSVDKNVFTEEQRASFQAIAAGVLGLEKSEYGRISVEFTEFKGWEQYEADSAGALAELRRREIFELIRTIVLYLVIGGCVVVLILKTYGLFKKEPEVTEEEEEELYAQAVEEEAIEAETEEMAALLEMATLGEIGESPKSPFREQVEKFIDKNPTAVADLLRNWLNEDYFT